MTREQQITAVKEMISEAVADGSITKKCATAIMNAYDAILALPLDVPGTLELINAKRAYPIKKYPYSNISDLMANADRINIAGEGFGEGATWMRDEIIKRNRP